jgi:hypothetical protein
MPAAPALPRLVQPAYLTHPPYVETLGPEVSDLGIEANFPPDPEQRLGLDLIFAMGPTGRSASFEFAAICSRQNLKTGLFKLAALGWLFLTDQRLVVWSAHEFRTAQEAFRDMIELIEGCPYLDRRVANIYRGNGDEAIELLGGQRLIFKARTKAGGRGLSGNKVVLDEAFALQPTHMGALLPTLAAQPDPQVLYGSSAGLADSAVLRSVRDRGRAGGDLSLSYAEWCDDLPGRCEERRCEHGLDAPGCRLDDRRRWARANPAMGRTRSNGTGITETYIAAERRALPPAEFARERLGWWDEVHSTGPIPIDAWYARGRAEGRPAGTVAFAVAAAYPDAEMCSIVVAGRNADGQLLVQVVRRDRHSGWVLPELRRLRDEHKPCAIVIPPDGPAGALVGPLQAAGFELVLPTNREQQQAAAALQAEVIGDAPTLRHYDQPELTAALQNARRHDIGDGWRWDRNLTSDPLEAAGLAAWGHATRAHLAVSTEPWGFFT